jgi:hypothetical protein
MALSEPSQTTVLRPKTQRAWWKESTVYQIYPSSFKSSSPTSGHGDIPGITSELDYIKTLGVDIVWLSPILASPQVDMAMTSQIIRISTPATAAWPTTTR